MRALIFVLLGGMAVAAPKKVAVEKRDMRQTLRMGVTAAPLLWAQLAAPSNGVVTQVFVDLVSRVKKGQKLATQGKDAVVAPFDGVVVTRNAQPGVFARQGDVLFTVIEPSKIRLELEVPETDAGKIRVGMPVTARFEALPNQLYQAKLSVIVPMIDSRTHRLHADADMDNSMMTVMAGMSGEASIATETKAGVTAIPLTAVLRQADGAWVQREDGKKSKVTLGIDDGEWVEVTSGLAAGEVVVAP
jgi:RND family efflux transporter MFP subunit